MAAATPAQASATDPSFLQNILLALSPQQPAAAGDASAATTPAKTDDGKDAAAQQVLHIVMPAPKATPALNSVTDAIFRNNQLIPQVNAGTPASFGSGLLSKIEAGGAPQEDGKSAPTPAGAGKSGIDALSQLFSSQGIANAASGAGSGIAAVLKLFGL